MCLIRAYLTKYEWNHNIQHFKKMCNFEYCKVVSFLDTQNPYIACFNFKQAVVLWQFHKSDEISPLISDECIFMLSKFQRKMENISNSFPKTHLQCWYSDWNKKSNISLFFFFFFFFKVKALKESTFLRFKVRIRLNIEDTTSWLVMWLKKQTYSNNSKHLILKIFYTNIICKNKLTVISRCLHFTRAKPGLSIYTISIWNRTI